MDRCILAYEGGDCQTALAVSGRGARRRGSRRRRQRAYRLLLPVLAGPTDYMCGALLVGAGVIAAEGILEGPGYDPIVLPVADANENEGAATAVEAYLLILGGGAGEAVV